MFFIEFLFIAILGNQLIFQSDKHCVNVAINVLYGSIFIIESKPCFGLALSAIKHRLVCMEALVATHYTLFIDVSFLSLFPRPGLFIQPQSQIPHAGGIFDQLTGAVLDSWAVLRQPCVSMH